MACLVLLVMTLSMPCALKSQSADCWIPVTENGRHGFIDTAGKLLFPLQPYHLGNVRDGLIVTNDGNGRMLWQDPERVCPTFSSGNSGLMTTRGEWVVPMGDHKIGYWGHGIYWVCTGGQAKQYCTEPHHMEGGRYTFVNAAGMLVDSLDDIALGFVDGFTLVHKNGRIALMDSTGSLARGFEFDRAIFQYPPFWRERSGLPDDRLWKLALRRDGKWVALQDDGTLLPLDWPAEPGDFGQVGWREQASPWIGSYMPKVIPCRCDPQERRSATYRPRDLTYAENFPSQARRAQRCTEIRAQGLAALGLETVEKQGQRALAEWNGKRLTPYGPGYFEAAGEGFVAVVHTIWSRGKVDPMLEFVEDFAPPKKPKDGLYTSSLQLMGLLTPKGKTVIPAICDEIRLLPKANLIEAATTIGTAYFDFQGKPVCAGKNASLAEIGNGCYVMYFEDHCEIRDTLHHVLHQDSFGMQKPFLDGNWLWYYSLYDGHYHARELKGDSMVTYALDCLSPEILAFKRKHPDYASDSTFLEPLENGHWRVAVNGRMGICDSNGIPVIPMEYDYIAFYAGKYELRKGDLYGLADASGKILFPVEYTHISPKACGYYRLDKEVDGRVMTAIMDLQGHTIWGWVPE